MSIFRMIFVVSPILFFPVSPVPHSRFKSALSYVQRKLVVDWIKEIWHPTSLYHSVVCPGNKNVLLFKKRVLNLRKLKRTKSQLIVYCLLLLIHIFLKFSHVRMTCNWFKSILYNIFQNFTKTILSFSLILVQHPLINVDALIWSLCLKFYCTEYLFWRPKLRNFYLVFLGIHKSGHTRR